jgi:ribosomal protein S1
MDDQILAVGDVVAATVTKSLPFGVLVEYADVPGLAKGVKSTPGDKLSLRVVEYDPTQRRFSAELA